jgi:hypothetical protein
MRDILEAHQAEYAPVCNTLNGSSTTSVRAPIVIKGVRNLSGKNGIKPCLKTIRVLGVLCGFPRTRSMQRRVGGQARLERVIGIGNVHLDGEHQVDPLFLGLHVARRELGLARNAGHLSRKHAARK